MCVKNMVNENFTEEQAQSYLKEMLPKLDYWKRYDELKCKEGDNPTLGILLCAETDRVWQQQVAFQNMDLVI